MRDPFDAGVLPELPDLSDLADLADFPLPDLGLDDVTAALAELPVLGALVADDDPAPRHWARRLLLLAVVGGVVAWLVRSRQPKRPDLSVVPPPRPTPSPTPPAPAPELVEEAVAATPPEPVAETVAAPLRSVPRAFSSPGAVLPGNHAGSAQPLPTGEAPGPEYVIKGNEQSMIFHAPGSASYARTVAEVWFASEEDALAAGFRPPRRRTKKGEG